MSPGMLSRLAAALALAAGAALAQPATDQAFEARLKRLEADLRCLVCQNQTLADSNAPLAEDLRREVRELAAQGKNDEQIKEFLVQRYGDFVLYKPPVKETTWLLWFGPFILLLGGGAVWWLIARHRSRRDDDDGSPPPASGPDATAESGVARARALLDNPLD